jgi:hypothetical protein
MNYYQIYYPGDNNEPITEVLTDDDIREQYYPHWYAKMCQKFGKDHVDANYSFQDCVDDWVIVHWATKV